MIIRSAKVMEIPIIVTEHGVKALGHTASSLAKHLTSEDKIIEKT